MDPKNSLTGRLITRFLNLFIQHQELQHRLFIVSAELINLRRANAALITALHTTRDDIDTLEAQLTSLYPLTPTSLHER